MSKFFSCPLLAGLLLLSVVPVVSGQVQPFQKDPIPGFPDVPPVQPFQKDPLPGFPDIPPVQFNEHNDQNDLLNQIPKVVPRPSPLIFDHDNVKNWQHRVPIDYSPPASSWLRTTSKPVTRGISEVIGIALAALALGVRSLFHRGK